jgi:antirestriction protein
MLNQTVTVSPRIYVACLAAYNAGKLHGRWIDADQDSDKIWDEVAAMLKASPEPFAEEWAIHDFEGFGDIHLSESSDFKRVSVLARMIQDHGDAFSIWYNDQDGDYFDLDELEEKFLEQWQGAHDSEVAFVDSLLEDTGQLSELPQWARNYFDSEAYARDLRLSGDYSFVRHDGQVYVYCCH